jgi:hypothetical protein
LCCQHGGRAARRIVSQHLLPSAMRQEGVEPDRGSIRAFQLRAQYDEIHACTIQAWI